MLGYRDAMSPTYPANIWKRINCWQCSQARGGELGPLGHILSLLETAGHCGNGPRQFWIASALQPFGQLLTAPRHHQLHARLWRQTDKPEPVSAGNDPESQKEGLQNPAADMYSGTSFWKGLGLL